MFYNTTLLEKDSKQVYTGNRSNPYRSKTATCLSPRQDWSVFFLPSSHSEQQTKGAKTTTDNGTIHPCTGIAKRHLLFPLCTNNKTKGPDDRENNTNHMEHSAHSCLIPLDEVHLPTPQTIDKTSMNPHLIHQRHQL